jgi:hypothetical protein
VISKKAAIIMNNRRVLLRVAMILALAASSSVAEEGISLSEQEYFAGPGFSFLLFHNQLPSRISGRTANDPGG